MKRLFKAKAVRTSTTVGLAASTHIPDSGLTFVNNSQGASASIGELAKVLDDVFNELEFEGVFDLLPVPLIAIPQLTRVSKANVATLRN